MKRRQLHQSHHPFNPQPFEAFWRGSWQPVEQLYIGDGAIVAHIVDDGEVTEESVPMQNLRVRSREASSSDCTSFLRPGIDVSVLSPINNDLLVWLDARIRSIERRTHGDSCTCRFYVSFYINQGPNLFSENVKLSKETSMATLDQIAILQYFDTKPCETQYYRWSSTEDCFSIYHFKFFHGKFLADLTWLLTASTLKKTAFRVKSVQNRIVYVISENIDCTGDEASSRADSYAVSFKMNNELLTPIVFSLAADNLSENSAGREPMSGSSSFNLMELRRSKRRHVQPERYLACDNLPNYEIEMTRLGENKYKLEHDEAKVESEEQDETFVPLSVQADNEFQQKGGADKWSAFQEKKTENSEIRAQFDSGFSTLKDEKGHNTEKLFNERFFASGLLSPAHKKKTVVFEMIDFEGGGKGSRRKYHRKHGGPADIKRECFYVRESIYDVKSYKKDSATAQLCREMIRRSMINIDDTLKNIHEQPPVVDQWKDFQSAKKVEESEKNDKKSEVENEEGIPEVDVLWREMDLLMASWYLLDGDDDNDKDHTQLKEKGENICQHDYRLDEQVGSVCQWCGFVETEIKDVLPPFLYYKRGITNRERQTQDATAATDPNQPEETSKNMGPAATWASEAARQENVWALIPDLGDKLRPHQRNAFEFLWRNIAGSLKPSRMERRKEKRGGCIISHTPGAGKTLLIIAFLVSYLKLFPGSRPLVLAPKTTLYTWYKEIIKWKISLPVYQIHGGQTYKGEVLKQRMKLSPGLPRNQDVLHVLDCLEKIQNWLSHPSILLMGYTSFLTLTRDDSSYAHRKYMAQLLKQCPGILILDEGHNPRSTKSRLRKGLMKVDTRLRVLLSGTLFQNNFGEYFNTLCLARPIFVNEVLSKLDPKYERRNRERRTQFSLENRGRKLLIDRISKKIDSNEGEERSQALRTLKKLTAKFIDVYEGGSGTDRLPGLQCYTLMMKLTPLQQEVSQKLQDRRPDNCKGFPLELELLITLGAIHPYLVQTTACSGQYFSPHELQDLHASKFDVRAGSKVRFVMNLIPRCILRNEKVLIFCHNIAPINLLLQIFERFYGWHKGREVLVLQGDIELFERGRVIEKFEEQTPSKVMLASITACAEGISLTAASRVILLDSEWNPSKSKQAIARAFRPGQCKVVYVYQLLGTGTLEEDKHGRTTWKEWVSDMIFSEEHVEDPSRWQAPDIEDEMLREIVEEDRAMLFHRIMKNDKASNVGERHAMPVIDV